MPSSKAVITGLGIVSSIGIGCDDYFDALINKRSGIKSLAQRTDEGAKPDSSQFDAQSEMAGLWIGAPIIDFDPKQYVRPRKSLKVMCREIQTAFAASQLAIEQAGLDTILPAADESSLEPARVGIVFGGEMYFGPPEEMADPMKDCITEQGTVDARQFGVAARRGVMPLWMLKYLPNMPACHIGISINAHGPNNSLILGDISGPAALMEAISYIRRGLCDVVITGSTGTLINTTRLNYRNDLPVPEVADPIEHSSRPHDPTSKGVVGGEGATGLVIESHMHAAQRGATVIAEIAGYASRFSPSQAFSNSDHTSAPQGQTRRGSSAAISLAIDAAIAQAGIEPSAIGLIVSHASGDPDTDAAEREALDKDLQGVPVFAPMAAIGHTGAASGSIAIVTAAIAVNRKKIPPTLSADTSPNVSLLSKASRLEKDYVLALAYTSEGAATAVILKSLS
ncbi:MAG: beta-ketoacyl synthase N-terminal-like domain-containing protein [Pirellulaceae bacterium]